MKDNHQAEALVMKQLGIDPGGGERGEFIALNRVLGDAAGKYDEPLDPEEIDLLGAAREAAVKR